MPEIIPSLYVPPLQGTPTIGAGEMEVNAARRAFSMAQELLSGTPVGAPQTLNTGWYDATTHAETGCFACVRMGAGQDDLIGEIVQVSYAGRAVFVYVLQALSGLSTVIDIGLTRRAYMAIARLSRAPVAASVIAVDA